MGWSLPNLPYQVAEVEEEEAAEVSALRFPSILEEVEAVEERQGLLPP